MEEACTVEVQKCWCGSWPGGAVVCSSLQRRDAATNLMHVCPATFQMLQTWPRGGGGGCGSFRPPVEWKTVSGGAGQFGGWAELISFSFSSCVPPPCYVCYLCFPWPVFSPPSSVSSIASPFLSLFLPSFALCLYDPFPWPRPH